jgi:O-antigen ligase
LAGAAFVIAASVAMDVRIGLALAVLLSLIIISWFILVGLGWWRKYGPLYISLYLLSILGGNLYLLPLGHVSLWISFADVFIVPSLVILFHEYRKRRPLGWPEFIGMILGVFWVLMFFRGILASQPTRALAGLKAIGSGLLIFSVAANARLNGPGVHRFLFPAIWLWGIGLLAMVVSAIVSVARHQGLSFTTVILHKVDYITPLGRTNYLAALALLLWPVSLYGTFGLRRGLRRLFGGLGTGAFVLVLFLLFSRGALIVFGVTLPFVLAGAILISHSFRTGIVVVRILSGGLGIAILVTILAVLRQRVEALFRSAWSLVTSPSTWLGYRTAQARVDLWCNAWDKFLESPVIGHGIYNVTSINPYSGSLLLVHNLPLQLLAESGIVGLALYSVALGFVAHHLCKVLWRQRKEAVLSLTAGVLVSMVVVLINSLIEPNFLTRDFDLLFWGLVGCVMSVVRGSPSSNGKF